MYLTNWHQNKITNILYRDLKYKKYPSVRINCLKKKNQFAMKFQY